MIRKQRFFVMQLDQNSYRPLPDAEFAIQVLDEGGQAAQVAYIGRESSEIIALLDAKRGQVPLAIETHRIPHAVIESAQRRRAGFGEYVDENGEVVRLTFLPIGRERK